MAEKVVIIGGGIGGLSAGIYALYNGYDVEIFESHTKPGGLCATWRRQGYLFDGCIHFLFGTVPGTTLYDVWNELGIIDNIAFTYHPEYLTLLSRNRQTISFFKDADKLDLQLSRISPKDKNRIGELCESIKTIAQMPTDTYRFPPELMGLPSARDHLSLLAPYLPIIRKLCSTTVEETFSTYFSELIKEGFYYILPPRFSLYALVWTFAQFHRGDGAWVHGGSFELANALEKQFIQSGGMINYGRRVHRVNCEDSRAVSISVGDGSDVKCDYVISTIDGHTVMNQLIDERYQSITLRECYERFEPISGITQVSLGLDADLSKYPHHECIELASPLVIAGNKFNCCILRHYCDDINIAPKGHSVITSLLHTPYDFWDNLRNDPKQYNQEKLRIAEKIKAIVIERYGLSYTNIKCVDVATPLTHQRMTGVWRGAYNGWIHSPESAFAKIPKTLPGVRNFFFAGQWIAPGGGLPLSAVSGRWAVQLLRHQVKKPFFISKGNCSYE